MTLSSVSDLKAQAKRLRKALADKGQPLSHSEALELISAQHGYRDWNTASATATRASQFRYSVGDRVAGTYMRQDFEGEIKALSKIGNSERYEVTILFDAPVDVVTFDSFSAYRSRVTCLVNANGVAVKRTSDGEPYMKLQAAR